MMLESLATKIATLVHSQVGGGEITQYFDRPAEGVIGIVCGFLGSKIVGAIMLIMVVTLLISYILAEENSLAGKAIKYALIGAVVVGIVPIFNIFWTLLGQSPIGCG